jgi:hypothetical protein
MQRRKRVEMRNFSAVLVENYIKHKEEGVMETYIRDVICSWFCYQSKPAIFLNLDIRALRYGPLKFPPKK